MLQVCRFPIMSPRLKKGAPHLFHAEKAVQLQYYALQFVRPIASLKSYHVTIQQSPVSDPPTEWKLYRIDPKLWWIMPAFDPSNITFVLLWLRCGLPPTPVVMTSRHNVVMTHGMTSQCCDVTPPLLIVLNMTSSYNGFAAKFIKNALKTLNKVNF
jgi:hypothetical protein